MNHMHKIVRSRGVSPKRALEVGGYIGEKSLLRSPEVADAERWCINLLSNLSAPASRRRRERQRHARVRGRIV